MERDYWYYVGARLCRAGEARRRGPHRGGSALCAGWARVKVETQKVPVVFEPRTARSLLDNIFDAVHGGAVYRNESFLAGKLGERVASEKLTVIDDGTIPGLFGTSPFDDEGVPTRRTVVIENGVLRSYLLNTYTARKLGLHTTGNASRGLAGNAGVGNGNLYIEKGAAHAGANDRGHSRRLLRHRADRLRSEYRDRGLFPRRGRALDSRRRTGVSGLRGDHRGHAAADADGPGSGRRRLGVSRVDGGADFGDCGDDSWWPIKQQTEQKGIPVAVLVVALVVILGAGFFFISIARRIVRRRRRRRSRRGESVRAQPAVDGRRYAEARKLPEAGGGRDHRQDRQQRRPRS